MSTTNKTNPTVATSTVRLATIDQLIAETLPQFISPIPCRDTLRSWFEAAGIPTFKANPLAKRGGGPVFYSVSAVEKFFRARTIPANATAKAR